MSVVNYKSILTEMRGAEVERPNKSSSGTLSGHAAGEPFEKVVYQHLKQKYPSQIFKQYEFLNELYRKNSQLISVKDRFDLVNSPTAMFLLNRSETATKEWTLDHLFEEKQSDTADIVFCDNGYYELIDVKTRNLDKQAQAPNIISAYKLARACALMIDNGEYDSVDFNYIEIGWRVRGEYLQCVETHYANLFSAPPSLYINWAAGMQIQFHVSELEQTWTDSRKEWAKEYIRTFVYSAQQRCKRMQDMYVQPFLKYLDC